MHNRLNDSLRDRVPNGWSDAHPSEEYPVHPIAELFPLLTGPEFEFLVASIQNEGQHYPIWLWRDQSDVTWLIDGRNRLRACRAAGVRPRYELKELKGSLVETIVALNIHRRHLEVGQLASIGADLMPHYEAEARAREHAGKTLDAGASRGKAADQVGKMLGISGDSIQRAKRVQQKGARAVREALAAGRISTKAAADIAKLPPTEQIKRLQEAEERARKGRTAKDRTASLERAARRLRGACRALVDAGGMEDSLNFARQALAAVETALGAG